jgi:uncharacterized protein (DUF302 family)
MTIKQLAYTKQTSKPVPQAVEAVTDALKAKTFGVLCTINVSKLIKEKTGKTIDDYFILDVCNPKDATYALSTHKEIGLALPCKIIVYKDNDKTLISLYRPTEALKTLGFTDLNELAERVECDLKQAIDSAVV